MSLLAVRRASYSLLTRNNATKCAYNGTNMFTMKSLSSQMFSTESEKKEKKEARTKETKRKVEAVKTGVKEMWRKYGLVFLGTHFGIYFTSWAALFLALDYNILNTTMIGLDPAVAVGKVL